MLASLLLLASSAAGQKTVHCPDGNRPQLEVTTLAAQYDASAFAGTLNSLSVLDAHLGVTPKKLQEAAVATEQWNVLLSGVAENYNSCALDRDQYADGLPRIYLRLKQYAASLEELRQQISNGRPIDERHLQSLLDTY